MGVHGDTYKQQHMLNNKIFAMDVISFKGSKQDGQNFVVNLHQCLV